MRIDLRSDTLTQPTEAMLSVMMKAEVGDDVFGEDPTINALEDKVAQIFGHESGLYCPSGTMTNQIAINVHTRPGDEVICDQYAHIQLYEGGGLAANSGATATLLPGDRGRITAEQVASVLKADDPHFPSSRLVALENTSNKGGGSIYALEEMQKIKTLCDAKDLALHLDGARVFNALNVADYSARELGAQFDSISICLSKGLGAPVGSVLIGNKEFIYKARRVRKRFGGGMRQAGFIAAAGIYALDHHVDRLAEDHSHAKSIGAAFTEWASVAELVPVETNIVIVHFKPGVDAQKVVEAFREKGIYILALGPGTIRLVTHLDVTSEMITVLLEAIKSLGKIIDKMA